MSELTTAWFILYCMANSSASVVVILIALCLVLMTGLLKEWICEIKVVTWFLILASDTMIVNKGLDDVLSTILSNFSTCFLMLEEQKWKEKWSKNKSISLFPDLNSLLKKEKDRKNSLCLSSTLISGDFSWSLCFVMRWSMQEIWLLLPCSSLELRMLLMIWLVGRDELCKRNHP